MNGKDKNYVLSEEGRKGTKFDPTKTTIDKKQMSIWFQEMQNLISWSCWNGEERKLQYWSVISVIIGQVYRFRQYWRDANDHLARTKKDRGLTVPTSAGILGQLEKWHIFGQNANFWNFWLKKLHQNGSNIEFDGYLNILRQFNRGGVKMIVWSMEFLGNGVTRPPIHCPHQRERRNVAFLRRKGQERQRLGPDRERSGLVKIKFAKLALAPKIRVIDLTN